MRNVNVIEILNNLDKKTLDCKLKMYTKRFIDRANNIDNLE